MKVKFFIFLFLLFVSSFPVQAEDDLKSTLEDQKNVEVTVYNNNLGLVKDTRVVNLPAGQGNLKFMDVASAINPVTVHIKSLSDPDSLNILEQNYEYDLISPEKLMDKYVGKQIKIIDVNPYQDKKETIEAILLSNNNGEVYKIGNDIYLGHPGYKVLPEIPENLMAKPTLTWAYDNKSAKAHELEVSYLTDNINWKADYILALNEKDTQADLSGWVTLDNKSGAAYKEAKLKLVAGEVNRIVDRTLRRRGGDMAFETMEMQASSPFEEQAFFEYHVYDLQRRTTIKDNQTKQINLLEASAVGVNKEFLVRGETHYYMSEYQNPDKKVPVEVSLKFKNAKDNYLGMPLPAGIVRVYKKDAQKSLQFVGEDRVKHTPQDEEVSLKIGKAFDVVAERAQTDFQVLGRFVNESEWEITLRNHKKEDITVGILEPVHSDWEIVSHSHPYKKNDAFSIRFDIPVPQGKEVKVKYRVRTRN